MTGSKCLKSALEVWMKMRLEKGGFDKILSKVRIISAKEGHVEAAMKVEQEHCNQEGTLHGGMSAYLVDIMSTMTCYSYNTGATVELNASYLAPAKLGSEITITAKTLKQGRCFTFFVVDICDSNTGKLLVTGRHTKYLAPAKLGSEITITAKTLKQGRCFTFFVVDICDSNTGKLLVTGRHTKYISS
ncbi:Phenylacetic acid degradation-related domain [Trinorchestia longiramus]|nr:Phenylacetic acid degradation-related domain [Trinorchestia longiramus]